MSATGAVEFHCVQFPVELNQKKFYTSFKRNTTFNKKLERKS